MQIANEALEKANECLNALEVKGIKNMMNVVLAYQLINGLAEVKTEKEAGDGSQQQHR